MDNDLHIIKNQYYKEGNKINSILLSDLDDTLIDTQGIKRDKASLINAIFKRDVYIDTYNKTKLENNGNYNTLIHAKLLLEEKDLPSQYKDILNEILMFSSEDITKHLYKDNIEYLKKRAQKEMNEVVILTRGILETQNPRLSVVFQYTSFISNAIVIGFEKETFFQKLFNNTFSDPLLNRLYEQKNITYLNDKLEENTLLSYSFPQLKVFPLTK